MSLHYKVGCDTRELVEKRLEEAWGERVHHATGDAKPTEIHVQTRHFYMALKYLPTTECHNRSILMRFPDWEKPHIELKYDCLLQIKKQ